MKLKGNSPFATFVEQESIDHCLCIHNISLFENRSNFLNQNVILIYNQSWRSESKSVSVFLILQVTFGIVSYSRRL